MSQRASTAATLGSGATLDRAEALVAQAAACLQAAPRPNRELTVAARSLYLQALTVLAPEEATAFRAAHAPLRRITRRVRQLLRQAKRASFSGWLRRVYRDQRRPLLASVGLLALLTLLTLLFPVVLAKLRPDVLKGRPFISSSTWAECHPQRNECGGMPTRIFFHTLDEDSPFVSYDLGQERTLTRVEVENRSDANLRERAVPLVLLLSMDGTTWHEAARRDYWFDIWRAELPKLRARYLKLMVPRRSILHLERVRAFE